MQTTILHLSLIDGVGPKTVEKIISSVDIESISAIYSFSAVDFMRCGIGQQTAQNIVDGLKNRQLLECELSLIKKYAASWTTIFDEAYPAMLKNIYLPPPVLYWQGHLNEYEKRIAIVGARKTNWYGQQVIESIVPDLVAHGFEIVSGGARGADTMAHQATVNNQGKTIVILGSGLLFAYPYENKKLFEKIIEDGGALVSAFPLQTEPHPGNFPARNRIIAGLSKGVVVIQAAQKSGARITAQFALEQGRDVFAIPGSIDEPLSEGCHALIKEGAQIVTSAQDILEQYGFVMPVKEELVQKKAVLKKCDSLKTISPVYAADSFEYKIIQVCGQPTGVDELAQLTKLDLAKLQDILFQMQLEGHLVQQFNGMWQKAFV